MISEPTDSQWLQALAEISPAAIYRANADGECIWVNEQWSRLTGRPSKTALGKGWEKAIHPDDRPRLKRHWQSDRFGNFVCEYRYLRPDGTVRWVLGRATEQRDPEGRIIGYIGVTVDMTELRPHEDPAQPKTPSTLSAREREVAVLLACGSSNRDVAGKLGISVRTAEAHRARIMRKLRIDSLPALVRYALHSGLIRE